jgi:phosphoserine phosphatase RsbU/P
LHKKLRPIALMAEKIKNVNVNSMEFDIPLKIKNEVGYLGETLNVMGRKLHTAQAEMIEKERMSRDLEIAREIQASILPRQYPSASEFQFAGAYSSAKEVGGDYYDFMDLDKNRFAFLVADVSGKSLPGMLVMLMVRDIVKQLAGTASSPADLLCQVNHELMKNIRKGMFVTMFYGVLDKSSGEFSFASAGHNPLILLRSTEEKPLVIRTKGFPLGIMPAEAFEKRVESYHTTLSQDDWLIQYTDGVNEAHNTADEEYGLDRLLAALKEAKNMNPANLVSCFLANHGQFVGSATQFDDITFIAMKWNGKLVDNESIHKEESVNAS